jgi:hypothetical protein
MSLSLSVLSTTPDEGQAPVKEGQNDHEDDRVLVALGETGHLSDEHASDNEYPKIYDIPH